MCPAMHHVTFCIRYMTFGATVQKLSWKTSDLRPVSNVAFRPQQGMTVPKNPSGLLTPRDNGKGLLGQPAPVSLQYFGHVPEAGPVKSGSRVGGQFWDPCHILEPSPYAQNGGSLEPARKQPSYDVGGDRPNLSCNCIHLTFSSAPVQEVRKRTLLKWLKTALNSITAGAGTNLC